MKTVTRWLLLLFSLTAVWCSCRGGNGSSSLVETDILETGDEHCPDGGVVISTGLDGNGNGILDDNEVTGFSYVCNGRDGEDGETPLVVNELLPGGDENCPHGGVAVHFGYDRDGDGQLDTTEIAATSYICNGGDGQDARPSGILQGSYVIRNSLDAYLISNVTSITGDLEIVAPGLKELELVNLESLGGGLLVHDNDVLEELSLPTLKSVGGSEAGFGVRIHGNENLAVVDLDALGTVEKEDLQIHNNSSLAAIFLGSLLSVAGEFAISSNPLLTEISLPKLRSIGRNINGYGLSISGNQELSTVEMSELQSVDGSFSIFENQALREVSLPALRFIGASDHSLRGIQVSENRVLTALLLDSLVSVAGSISIYRNSSLSTVSLKLLSTIGADVSGAGLELHENENLSAVNMESLESVAGFMSVSRNPALQELSAPCLQTVAVVSSASMLGIMISENDSLKNVGLEALQYVYGFISISNNSSLETISLASLREIIPSVSDMVSLNISSNESLTKLDLDSLVSVEGCIAITVNPVLPTLSLASLQTVRSKDYGIISLEISGNDALTNVSIDSLSSVASSVWIKANGSLRDVSLAKLRAVGMDLYSKGLNVFNNTALVNINMNELSTVEGSVAFYNNALMEIFLPALQSVGGFSGITGFDIRDNEMLGSISMDALTTVVDHLLVQRNPGLTSISLAALVDIGYLGFVENTSLCRSLVDALLARMQADGWSGSASVSGNDDSC